MQNPSLESNTGSILVIIYTLFTLSVIGASIFCSAPTCKVGIVFPVLPWAPFFENRLDISLPWAVYPFFLLFNSFILYSIGVALELLYFKYKEMRSNS